VPRTASLADADAVAAIHAERIAEGFLVTLGAPFLRRLYRRIVRSPHAFVLVADDDRGVCGFVAVAEDTRRLYREFLVRDALVAAIAAAPAVVRAPGRVWETLRYGTAGGDDLPPAEILAVAVTARAERRGIGVALVRAAVDELARRTIAAARVVTAVGNEPALAMYERAGFRRFRRTDVHKGVAQEVLVWG
jgi:ribosomal protein S18 acetylase RimI-like enzyme